MGDGKRTLSEKEGLVLRSLGLVFQGQQDGRREKEAWYNAWGANGSALGVILSHESKGIDGSKKKKARVLGATQLTGLR